MSEGGATSGGGSEGGGREATNGFGGAMSGGGGVTSEFGGGGEATSGFGGGRGATSGFRKGAASGFGGGTSGGNQAPVGGGFGATSGTTGGMMNTQTSSGFGGMNPPASSGFGGGAMQFNGFGGASSGFESGTMNPSTSSGFGGGGTMTVPGFQSGYAGGATTSGFGGGLSAVGFGGASASGFGGGDAMGGFGGTDTNEATATGPYGDSGTFGVGTTVPLAFGNASSSGFGAQLSRPFKSAAKFGRGGGDASLGGGGRGDSSFGERNPPPPPGLIPRRKLPVASTTTSSMGKLFVRFSPTNVLNEQQLQEYFSKFGPIATVTVHALKKIAYLAMVNESDAERAIQATHDFGMTVSRDRGAAGTAPPMTTLNPSATSFYPPAPPDDAERKRLEYQALKEKLSLLEGKKRHNNQHTLQQDTLPFRMETAEEEAVLESVGKSKLARSRMTHPPSSSSFLANDPIIDSSQPERSHNNPAPPITDSTWGVSHFGNRAEQYVIGTCTLMCPPSVTQQRLGENTIDLLEKTHPEMPWLGNNLEKLVMMKFQRSGAGVEMDRPEMIRTEQALDDSAAHLWNDVLDIEVHGMDARFRDSPIFKGDTPTPVFVFGFVTDRTRRIRSEFTLQGYTKLDGPRSLRTARIFEECVRFHILVDHELCNITKEEGHDASLNRKELNNSLKHVFDLYQAGQGEFQSPYEGEMTAYNILLQMDSTERLAANVLVESIRPEISGMDVVRLARKTYNAYLSGDYFTFFQIFRSSRTPFLFACLMHSVLTQMRAVALDHLNGTFHVKQQSRFPVNRLVNLLCFDDLEEAEEFCHYAGLEIMQSGAAAAATDSSALDDYFKYVMLGEIKPLEFRRKALDKRVSQMVVQKRGVLPDEKPIPRRAFVADPSRGDGPDGVQSMVTTGLVSGVTAEARKEELRVLAQERAARDLKAKQERDAAETQKRLADLAREERSKLEKERQAADSFERARVAAAQADRDRQAVNAAERLRLQAKEIAEEEKRVLVAACRGESVKRIAVALESLKTKRVKARAFQKWCALAKRLLDQAKSRGTRTLNVKTKLIKHAAFRHWRTETARLTQLSRALGVGNRVRVRRAWEKFVYLYGSSMDNRAKRFRLSLLPELNIFPVLRPSVVSNEVKFDSETHRALTQMCLNVEFALKTKLGMERPWKIVIVRLDRDEINTPESNFARWVLRTVTPSTDETQLSKVFVSVLSVSTDSVSLSVAVRGADVLVVCDVNGTALMDTAALEFVKECEAMANKGTRGGDAGVPVLVLTGVIPNEPLDGYFVAAISENAYVDLEAALINVARHAPARFILEECNVELLVLVSFPAYASTRSAGLTPKDWLRSCVEGLTANLTVLKRRCNSLLWPAPEVAGSFPSRYPPRDWAERTLRACATLESAFYKLPLMDDASNFARTVGLEWTTFNNLSMESKGDAIWLWEHVLGLVVTRHVAKLVSTDFLVFASSEDIRDDCDSLLNSLKTYTPHPPLFGATFGAKIKRARAEDDEFTKNLKRWVVVEENSSPNVSRRSSSSGLPMRNMSRVIAEDGSAVSLARKAKREMILQQDAADRFYLAALFGEI